MAEGLKTTTSMIFDGGGGATPRGRSGGGGQPKWYGGDVNLQYDVTIPDPGEFRKYLDDSGKFFSEADRQFLAGRIHNKGIEQRDAARSREQQEGNYAYQNWNLAQDNPRGNLNQMSYGDTLRYSRLADMLNNQFHYRPGNKNLIGTGRKGIMQQADSATVSRWDPIETEEMRQMQANREMDRRARQAGIDLQSRIQAYPQDVQEALDEADREFQKFLSEHDVQFIQEALMERLRTEYSGSWRNFFQMCLETYNKELELSIGKRILDAVKHLTPNQMQVALQVLLRQATVPDYYQMLDEQINAEIIETLMAQGYPRDQATDIMLTMANIRNSLFSNNLVGEAYAGGGKKPRPRRPNTDRNDRDVNTTNSYEMRFSGRGPYGR